ncbi:MAG: hypothetical protein J5940_02320 [Clostridia bacterium]|nr:hypothetical protein [Clostridia bacterium]
MKKEKDKKKKDIDDYADYTVANMNVEGMPWYKSPESKKRDKEMNGLNLSKSERRAMIRGAFAAMLPAFLIGLAVFCAAFGLLMLYFYLVS